MPGPAARRRKDGRLEYPTGRVRKDGRAIWTTDPKKAVVRGTSTPDVTAPITKATKDRPAGPQPSTETRRALKKLATQLRTDPIEFRAETKTEKPSLAEALEDVLSATSGDHPGKIKPTDKPSAEELEIASLIVPGLGVAGAGVKGARLASKVAKAIRASEKAAKAGKVPKSRAVRAGRAAKTGAKRKAEKVRTAPQRAGRKVKQAPQKARKEAEALATKEGRRRAAKRSGKAAARGAYAHPVVTSLGTLGAAHKAGIGAPGGKEVDALISGHVDAVRENPVGTTQTTARALAASVAGLAALGFSVPKSVIQQSTDPITETAGHQVEGLKEIGEELLSGNRGRVQKAVEEDVGLLAVAPLPAVTRTKAYKAARSRARARAKSVRKKVAEKTGLPLRHGPGEQNIFGFTERRGQRKRIARMAQRETSGERLRASRQGKKIERAARKSKGARSLRNVHGIETPDLIQVLAEYGIRRPEDLKLLREKGPVGEVPRKGDVTLRAVLDFAERNPKLLQDKNLQKALDLYAESTARLPASKAGKGKRAAAAPQGELFGVRRPEDRVPHAARAHTKAEDRKGAWRDLKESEKGAKGLRTQARKALAQAEVKTGKEAAALRAKSRTLYAAAKKADADAKELRKALNPYTRPGQSVGSGARRKQWDQRLLNEYVEEVNRHAAAEGLEPGIWTHHAPIRQEGETVTQSSAPTRVQHVRTLGEGSLAARDAVDRSFRALQAGSVAGPRLRAGGQALQRKFFSEEAVALQTAAGTKRRVSQQEFAQAIAAGQLSEKHFIWVPERHYKQGFTDPLLSPDAIASQSQAILKGEITKESAGAKGVVVPKESFKEYSAQIRPMQNGIEMVANAVQKSASRVLLFSPGWLQAQMIAEALPIILANPRLASPAKLAQIQKRLREYNRLHPDEAAGFAAAMGEAPVRVATARELSPRFSVEHGHFYNAARAIERNPIGRALYSTARLRPAVLFDQWRTAGYRKVLAAAEADRRLNNWTASLQGALRTERKLSDELRHLPKDEQLAALMQPRYRKDLDKLADYVDNIAGNWQAFTRFERSFAPALVFYGFIRYSLRWPFTFAREHPASAQAAYLLAQVNSNELEKILGAKPANPVDYTSPVAYDEDGAEVYPIGSRITPGLSAPTEGIFGGSGPRALVGALNPLYGAGLGLATGTNSFGDLDYRTGPLDLHTQLAIEQLTSMPPIARLFGVGQSDSPTAQELRENDPNRKIRSFGAPYLPQSGESARRENEIIRGLEGEDSGSGTFDWKSVTGDSTSDFDWKTVTGG